MALYVPASRRRRRTAIIGVVALVAGLVIGLLIGRTMGSSAEDDVAAAQRDASALIARLDGLSLEYEQTASGGAGGSDAAQGALDAARGIASDTRSALEGLPWVTSAQRDDVLAALDAITAAVEEGAPPSDVHAAVGAAEAQLRAAVGLEAPAP